jgi:hypothetical protein
LVSIDGIGGVATQLFKLRAKLMQRKIINYFNVLFEKPGFAGERRSHLKFAIRSFLVRRTISMQPHKAAGNVGAGRRCMRHICAIAQMRGSLRQRLPISRNRTGQAAGFQSVSANSCVGMSIAFPRCQSMTTAVRRAVAVAKVQGNPPRRESLSQSGSAGSAR